MPNIIIEDLFNITNANLNIDAGATIVTGQNSAGKSSVATVISALVCLENNPMKLQVSNKRQYVRDGSAEGHASLYNRSSTDLFARWSPKTGTIKHDVDVKPLSTPYTVGLVDFMDMNSKKDRIQVFQYLLSINLDPMLLLKDCWTGGKNNSLEDIVELIKTKGWDAAASIYSEKATDEKRRWRDVTGEAYGEKKALEWKPNGYRAELDGKTVAEADTDYNNAKTTRRDVADRLTRQAQLEVDLSNLKDTQRELEAKKSMIENLPPEGMEYDSSYIEGIEAEITKIEADEREKSAELDSITDALQANQQKAADAGDANRKIEMSNRKAQEFNDAQVDYNKLKESVKEVDSTGYESRKAKIVEIHTERLGIEGEIKLLNNALTCPCCDKKLFWSSEGGLSEASVSDEGKEALTKRIDDLSADRAKLHAENEAWEAENDANRKTIHKMEILKNQYPDIEGEPKEIQAIEDVETDSTDELLKSKRDTLRNEIKAINDDVHEKKMRVEQKKREYRDNQSAITEHNNKIQNIKGQLDAVNAQIEGFDDIPDTKDAHEERANAENDEKIAEENLACIKKFSDAKMYNENVLRYNALADLLKVEGVRKTAAQKKVDSLRNILDTVNGVTGWERVSLGEDYRISCNGREVQMAAENEKLKAQYTMQTAIAILQYKAGINEWLIFDRADTLKGKSYEGLVNLVNTIIGSGKYPNMKIVICGTLLDNQEGWKTLDLDEQVQ